MKIIKDLFNQHRRENLWIEKETQMKSYFRLNLTMLKAALDAGFPLEHIEKISQCMIGYNGLMTTINTGIVSREALGKKKGEYTEDHWLGTTLIGKYVIKEFIKHNLNIDYMVDEWLYENLYIWGTIRITQEEHHPHNLGRNSHTLEEKSNGEHYNTISELVYNYRNSYFKQN